MDKMNKFETTSNAYKEVLEIIEKHKDTIRFNIKDFKERADKHLWGLEIQEVYGLNIPLTDIYSTTWHRVGEYAVIGFFGDKTDARISWEDNNLKPDNEYLLVISFPTGPYALGEYYMTDVFREFFNELKSYNPKYCDTTNSGLYFTLDNAKDIYNNLEGILDKYKVKCREKFNELYKQKEIENLEKRLSELKS
jgi:hypothetical protein